MCVTTKSSDTAKLVMRVMQTVLLALSFVAFVLVVAAHAEVARRSGEGQTATRRPFELRYDVIGWAIHGPRTDNDHHMAVVGGGLFDTT